MLASVPGELDENGWQPIEDLPEVADTLYMHDFELLPDIIHPLRGTLLRRLKEPKSVAELAAAVDMPVTRLYHHVNRLEQLGLIRVVATRRSGATTERCYQVAARSYRLADELFDTSDRHELAQALGSLFVTARLGLQREVEAGGFDHMEDRDEHFTLSLGEVRLSHERRVDLMARLRDVFHEFTSDADHDDPDGTTITLFLAAYPDTS